MPSRSIALQTSPHIAPDFQSPDLHLTSPWPYRRQSTVRALGISILSLPNNASLRLLPKPLGDLHGLEDVQYLAGHANPKTTQIYDRRRRRVTRNIVERISV